MPNGVDELETAIPRGRGCKKWHPSRTRNSDLRTRNGNSAWEGFEKVELENPTGELETAIPRERGRKKCYLDELQNPTGELETAIPRGRG